MRTRVLLNLLNELGRKKLDCVNHFIAFFATILINSTKPEHVVRF